MAKVVVDDDNLSRHAMIMGASGYGKTTLLESLILQQINRGGGACIIDAKMDIKALNDLYCMCRQANRTDDLKVINIDNPGLSHTYNPFVWGDADELASRAMLVFPDATGNPASEHFKSMRLYALTAVIGAIKETKKAFNFLDLSILLSNPKALEHLNRITPASSTAKKNLELFLEQLRDKEGRVKLQEREWLGAGALSGTFFVYGQGNTAQVMNTYTPEVVMRDVMMKNQIVYVMLPSMGKAEIANNLAKIIIADIRSAIYQLQKNVAKLPIPFMLVMDEFNRYASAGGTDILFEQARSANVSCIPAFQSVKREYESLIDTVLANTSTKVFFRLGKHETAELAAKLIGQEIKQFNTSTRGMRWDPFEPLQFLRRQKNKSVSEKYDFTVRPEDFMTLEKGEAIILQKNNIYKVKAPMVIMPVEPHSRQIALVHTDVPWRSGLNLISTFDPQVRAKN